MTKHTTSDDETVRAAKARLDQMRTEAGGALSGKELRERAGLDPEEANDPPPLDWSPTPINIALQAIAIAVFLAVVWFVATRFFGGMTEIFTR